MKKLVVLWVAFTMCIAACTPEPPRLSKDEVFLTEQASWTSDHPPDPCMDMDNGEDALARVLDAKARFDDATILMLATMKASDDPPNSAAFTTAMAELNRAKQDTQNLNVPYCIFNVADALATYTNLFTKFTMSCVYDDKCEDRLGGAHTVDKASADYYHSLRNATCIFEETYTETITNPDGRTYDVESECP